MNMRDIVISIGGKELPVNPFVREVTESVILAVLGTLKKVNLDDEIVITIRPSSDAARTEG